MFSRVVEVSMVLIIIYLIVQKASGVSLVTSSVGRLYIDAIKAFQGR